MSWLDVEKKRKYQREWRRRKRATDPAWHEHEKEAKRAYGHPEFVGAQALETLERLRERRWRFTMQEVARVRGGTMRELLDNLTTINQKELYSPTFIFEYKGVRTWENLHSLLLQ